MRVIDRNGLVYDSIDYSPYLTHHGILGQKWGKQNGPPYPLSAGKHSAAEKKAGWRKSLASGAGNAIKATGRGLKRAGKWTVDRVKMSKRFPNRFLSDEDLAKKKDRYARENEVRKAMGKRTADMKLAEKAEARKYRREMAKIVLGETMKAIGSQAISNYIKKKLETKADMAAKREKNDIDFDANVRGDIYKDARSEGFSAKAAERMAKAGVEFVRPERAEKSEDPYKNIDNKVKQKAQEKVFDEAVKAGKSVKEALKLTREGGSDATPNRNQYDKPLEVPLPPRFNANKKQYDKPLEIPLPPKPKEKITYNSNTFTRENSDDFIGPPRKRAMTGAAAEAHYKKSYINMKLRDLWNSGFKDAHVVGGKIVFANGERAWNVDSGFKSYIDYIMKGLA